MARIAVMATQRDAPAALGSSPDARLLVDIDLSILGSPAERYDQDVRREYARVPGSGIRRQGRRCFKAFSTDRGCTTERRRRPCSKARPT